MQSKKILFVDDEADLGYLMKRFLETEGYNVSVAHDGQEGLEKAIEENPDLILLDVMMPRMNGFQMCTQLKNHTSLQNIPVIFVTALHQCKDEFISSTMGANGYVTKPFEHQHLLSEIARTLQ